jgi:hypothetical protein
VVLAVVVPGMSGRVNSPAARPSSVGFDPFRSSRRRRWQAQVKNWDCLAVFAAAADGHDLIVLVDVDALNGDQQLLLTYSEKIRFPTENVMS